MHPAPLRTLSRETLELPVRGRNLDDRTLGEVFAQGPLLLVFLRHFG